ncbi:unnamed protein product, partial [Meganyctiphanes norvegica]|uniref:Adiponectin receptor protein n=1 Tax=Meganyctiphanes norvegica TaxID=48144 RepID=A0AAV2SEB9_MEGNR
MDGKDKSKENILKDSNIDESGFVDEAKDNLRQRSTKHAETRGNDIKPSENKHEISEPSEDKVPGLKLVNHSTLPKWLQDNEFHINHNRPPLPSFAECFKSVFKLHTETGNIWTHLVGCVAAILGMIYYMSVTPVVFQEKLIISAYFVGAILCLGFSATFHTVMCHSEFVCTLFRKLDYSGISCLITGSTVPFYYFIFYCDFIPKVIYISMVITLGITTLIFSLLDKFGTPEYRATRSLAFVIFGLSAVIPAVHYMSFMDWDEKINIKTMQSMFLLAFFYIAGAAIYAARVPEKLFPGKCDLWIQSHQIFHVFVLAGAYVTYYGLKELVSHRHMYMDCAVVNIPNVTSDNLTNDI